MSPFMRLHFRARRAYGRGRALATLVFRLALLALGMFLAIEVGQFLVTMLVGLATLVVAVFIVGSFTAEWRGVGVRLGNQYRRLTRRPTRRSTRTGGEHR